MNPTFSAAEFGQLARGLLKPSALIELAIFFACLLLAWVVVRLLRGATPTPGSTWFGDRIVDGALFPGLARPGGARRCSVYLLIIFRCRFPRRS